MMRFAWILLALLSTACAAATPEPEPAPPAVEPSGPFEAQYTGQEQPTLTVVNDYTLAQFVFIDGAAPFVVAAGSRTTVDIAPGTHVLIAADTSNPAGADAVRTELAASTGYTYSYRIFVREGAAPPAQQAAPGIQAEYTGQEQPTITVLNEFPIVQYVFVDGGFVGAVAVGGTARFNVEPGSHDVACSDSMNPNENPVRDRIDAQQGYNYNLRVYVIGQP